MEYHTNLSRVNEYTSNLLKKGYVEKGIKFIIIYKF
ncbi:hypothetical protein qdsa001_133 [Staphylococcus phage qdsa001]|nr:hypothetical protein qdsa001_133 [Staphylococcus phage qdsa001]